MLKAFLFIPLAAVLQSGQQDPVPPAPDRKVRIEIVSTENGETKRITKEFDASDDAQVEQALREMGVLKHMRIGPGERDITIDIRGFGAEEDGMARLRLAPAPPAPPSPPAPPAAPQEPMAYLGVSTRGLEQDEQAKAKGKQGAVVMEVMDGSPAAALGLKEGDIIVKVGGQAVDGPQRLSELVRAMKPGDAVKVEWLRDGKAMKDGVKLAEREAEAYSFSFDADAMKELAERAHAGAWASERQAFLGVTPAEGDGGQPGVAIGSVESGSAAEQMGLAPGDRITAINGEAVTDFPGLAARIKAMKPGDEVTVSALRDGMAQERSGTLGERRTHAYIRHGDEGFEWQGMAPEDREMLRREMDELRREMDELRRELGKDMKREVRVRVESRALTAEEKALLRDKGVAVDKELQLDLQVFPNPSAGFFRLRFDVPERGDLNVDVHDAKGERVHQERIVGFKGRYERTLDLSDRAAGNYYVVVAQGGRTATAKLVKE